MLSALLCTGTFPGLASAAPLLQPDRLLVGVLRSLSRAGRLGVLTPSPAHVPQTAARWRVYGFEPVLGVLSPYDEKTPTALALAAEALAGGEAGVAVLDCMGYQRKTKDDFRGLLGVPVLQANLLLARVAAELAHELTRPRPLPAASPVLEARAVSSTACRGRARGRWAVR